MSFRPPGVRFLVRTSADRIVQANGIDLCVETFGDPAAPAILLLHGAGSSMLSWDEELCEELRAFLTREPPEPDWADRAAVIDYLVEAERPYAARSRPFDEAAMRDLSGRVFDRSADIAAQLTNPFIVDAGDPWRERLAQVAAPTLVVHGTEDPLFPYGHARALANEIPGADLLALEQTGHEYVPRATWNRVVPIILRHTSGRSH
jgi:pimeloyl-ACP methyl ester carboxylesterase